MSISLKKPIGRLRCSTFTYEKENHVFLENVKKSKTDFDFFPRQYKVCITRLSHASQKGTDKA